MENCKIVTRILDGEFLNYKNVIPSNWDTRILVNKNSIQNSFERISLISASSVEKEKKYPVKVNVDIGKVIISCTNQTGEAKEELFQLIEQLSEKHTYAVRSSALGEDGKEHSFAGAYETKLSG